MYTVKLSAHLTSLDEFHQVDRHGLWPNNDHDGHNHMVTTSGRHGCGLMVVAIMVIVAVMVCDCHCRTPSWWWWWWCLIMLIISTVESRRRCVLGVIITRKLCYRKDDCAMRFIHGCPENFRDSLTTPTATIPNIFHGLLFGWTLWMFLPNLKSVALSVPEIIGGTQKIWTVPGYAHAPFSRKFLIGF